MQRPRAEPNESPEPAWWQHGGTERCPHCTHLYVYEMEYRCRLCDAPVCPACVTIRTRSLVLCPSCAR